jgi:hypothetical protein
MEHAVDIRKSINLAIPEPKCGEVCDENSYRYVGWTGGSCVDQLFDPQTVAMISKKVTELTLGVLPNNQPIIVPDETICHVIFQIYSSYRPRTGDPFTRYFIPSGEGPQDYVQSIIDQTIEIITSDVSNSLEMQQNNEKLTAWTTVLGDWNEHGLQSHSQIKVRNKRPAPMQFNMNY